MKESELNSGIHKQKGLQGLISKNKNENKLNGAVKFHTRIAIEATFILFKTIQV